MSAIQISGGRQAYLTFGYGQEVPFKANGSTLLERHPKDKNGNLIPLRFTTLLVEVLNEGKVVHELRSKTYCSIKDVYTKRSGRSHAITYLFRQDSARKILSKSDRAVIAGTIFKQQPKQAKVVAEVTSQADISRD